MGGSKNAIYGQKKIDGVNSIVFLRNCTCALCRRKWLKINSLFPAIHITVDRPGLTFLPLILRVCCKKERAASAIMTQG